MIFTECVKCGNAIIVPLEESYLEELEKGRALVSKEICEKCGTVNFVEHRRVGGETFGEDDERAKRLNKKGEI